MQAADVAAPVHRRLQPTDLDTVVAIDASNMGRARRAYFERRLAAALRSAPMHVQFGLDDERGLAGFLLARKLEGEFGRFDPAYRLEAIGVRPGEAGHGIGSALLRALEDEARQHGIRELRTNARWDDHAMLRFLDHGGFTLGRNQIIDCHVDPGPLGASDTHDVAAPEYVADSAEIDYGQPRNNDFETLDRDRADVRAMAPADLPHLVRIDRKHTGRDRVDYMRRKMTEALEDSGIRVSLTARIDDIVAGFVMASVDYGDFGRTEAVAVIDTIGVDPDYGHRRIGRALISQLYMNLSALNVERVETVAARENFDLLRFLYGLGFEPAQRLGFVKRLAA